MWVVRLAGDTGHAGDVGSWDLESEGVIPSVSVLKAAQILLA